MEKKMITNMPEKKNRETNLNCATASFKNKYVYISKLSCLSFDDFLNGKRLNRRDEKNLVVLYQQGKQIIDAYNSNNSEITHSDYIDILELVNRAMDLLVFQFYGLAIFHAKRYKGLGVDYQDLLQEGLFAIIQIVQNYSYDSKRPLAVQISWRMRNKMYRLLAASGSSVKLPEKAYRIYFQYKTSEEELTEINGEDVIKPSREEVLKKINVDENTYADVERFAHVVSFDNDDPNSEDSINLSEIINSPYSLDYSPIGQMNDKPLVLKFAEQEKELFENESLSEIKTLIGNLPDKNQKAVTMRFGFDAGVCKSYEQIGKELNTNKVQASRLVKEGLQLIKKSVIEFNLQDYLFYDI